MRSLLHRLASWLARKTAPGVIRNAMPERPGFVDTYRRVRAPTPHELLAELKNVAYACASLNAAVCATYPPRLYVSTHPGEETPRCLTRSLSAPEQRRLLAHPGLPVRVKGAEQVREVLDHPLLALLRTVNPQHSAHDLWELTTLYQEVHGSAYWNLTFDELGVPEAVWILPSQNVRAIRQQDSPNLVDYYEVQTRPGTTRLPPESIIHFRYPNPREPYGPGLSPLRAAYEHAIMSSEFLAYKHSVWANNALPSVIISPDEILSEEERDRLEAEWTERFARGGNGRVLVTEASMSVSPVNASLGDLAALAEAGATKEEIANAFGVPLSYLTTQTNLANLQAAELQHAALAIWPRLCRRDEKLNEQLVPLYDPSGRLFLASDDPTPRNQQYALQQAQLDLRWGVRSINEVRAERGLPPVEWGDRPWLPVTLAPTDFPDREAIAPHVGRARASAE